MSMRGVVRVRPIGLRHASLGDVGDIVIEELV